MTKASRFFVVVIVSACFAVGLSAQESPYIVTYDHYLEEPGNLELEYFSTFGSQRAGNDFHAFWTEFEYGATAWWTTEFYLDWQTTYNDGTLFTGFRWENRFRMLGREHFVNPVLYVEYEQITDADKIRKEIEGHDVEADYRAPNAVLRQALNHELEFKVILSKSFSGWNLAANPILTKNLSPNNPWEFGYAMGVSRWLAVRAVPHHCSFCAENFILGVEMYGGLGDAQEFGLRGTSHYLAPVAVWNLPSGWAFRGSTAFGLNEDSHRWLLRFGVSREVSGFGEMVAGLFGRSRSGDTIALAEHHRGHRHYEALARVPAAAAAVRNPLESDTQTVAAGAKLFNQNCAQCHGAQAQGTRRGPSLREAPVQEASPGALYWILSNGVIGRGMPDWSKLPDQMRWQVVTFLKSHRGVQ